MPGAITVPGTIGSGSLSCRIVLLVRRWGFNNNHHVLPRTRKPLQHRS